ncbi:MAG: hypothetical protein RL326_1424, partial [Pseudomonadota bacterium]
MISQLKLPFERRKETRVERSLDSAAPSSPSKSSFIGMDFALLKRSSFAVSTLSRQRPMRLRLIGVLALIWTGGLVARMYSLQVSDFETWQDWAVRQHVADVEIASERGPVLDRNGKLMAVSVPAQSIYVRPRQVQDKQRVSKQLSALLGMKASAIAEKLNSKQPFVWLKRQLPRYQAEKITEVSFPGVGAVLESRRFYPYNNAASALIGKVGIDG